MEYNNGFIKILETIANMLIVSFLWLMFSLPIITIVPACSALYHTVNKIIFGPGRGNGVFKDFFESYKTNLISGMKLSVLCIVIVLFILEGLWTGYQFYKVSILGMLYMMLGIIITLVVTPMLIYIPPVLSRFDAPMSSIFRISVFITMKKPLRAVLFVFLLAAMGFMVSAFPLALLIVPALYADLIRGPLENDLKQIIEENDLQEMVQQEQQEETEEAAEEDSAFDLDRKLSEKRKSGKK